jgi:hypothetical protein
MALSSPFTGVNQNGREALGLFGSSYIAYKNLKCVIFQAMLAFRLYLTFAAFLLQSGASSYAQSAAATMPTDPKALLELAANLNQLESKNLKPWRITIAYESMDDDSKVKHKGTITESWAATNRSRIEFNNDSNSWQDFITDTGVMRVGTPDDSAYMADQILHEFTHPFPEPAIRGSWVMDLKDQKVGSATLKCVSVTGYNSDLGERPLSGFAFYIAADQPILRISSMTTSHTQITHNNLQRFQDHYLPGDIVGMQSGKIMFKAHLESIALLDAAGEAAHTPPANATPLERRIAISSGVAQQLVLRQVHPSYSGISGVADYHGSVMIQVDIGKDGRVQNTRPVSGPTALQADTMDSIKQWTYRPYVFNGEAVPVETIVVINFNPSH